MEAEHRHAPHMAFQTPNCNLGGPSLPLESARRRRAARFPDTCDARSGLTGTPIEPCQERSRHFSMVRSISKPVVRAIIAMVGSE